MFAMDESQTPRLTYKVELPGGQSRLQEAALYIMEKCAEAEAFGLTKLNKILWRADFRAYASRRLPVTGRQYQRLPQGPVPVEMFPVLQEMLRYEYVRIERRPVGPYEEQRPIPLVKPSLRYFSPDDLAYLDASVADYWGHSARDVSEDSHGVAWATRENGDPMAYDLALLLDAPLAEDEAQRLANIGRKMGWRTH